MPPPYCTNVHPGATLQALRASLDEHAVAVRNALVDSGDLGRDEMLPLGAWLGAPVAFGLRDGGPGALASLRRWLDERRLAVVTLNGFPFDDFHAPRVKHDVYLPDWTAPQRLDYTRALIDCLPALAQGSGPLSISTLPLGWPMGAFTMADEAPALEIAAGQLINAVEHARRAADCTGRIVRLDLEPEPGCVLQRSSDVAVFVERFLRPEARRRGVSDEALATHLGVCLDVCHLAVMFEEPADFVANVRAAGVGIGKVQVSSAPRVDFRAGTSPRSIETLRRFAEDRYLHQTMVRFPDGSMRFSDDLPGALAWVSPDHPPVGEWRVHFHVPIHLQEIPGHGDASPAAEGTMGSDTLSTTRDLIVPALQASAADRPTIEVETYAWSVLPDSLRPRRLADGIAEELREATRLMTAAERPSATAPLP